MHDPCAIRFALALDPETAEGAYDLPLELDGDFHAWLADRASEAFEVMEADAAWRGGCIGDEQTAAGRAA